MADRYRDRPFPADDDYGRDNSRIAPQQQGASDPLAELARLIGQADPFSNFGQQAQPSRHVHQDQLQRDQVQHDQYAAPDPYASEPYAPEPYPEEESVPASRPSWVQNLTAGRQPHEPSYREDDYHEPRYADDLRDPHFDHSGYDPLPQDQARGQQAAGDRYDDVLYGQPEREPAHGYAQDGAYQDGSYDDGYDRPPYDDDHEAPKQRRGGMMTVVVVLLLAVVGTGAAFAYRTFVGSPRSGEPPVIKADAGPNKVIPPGAGDGSGKQITDRLGDKTAERMVSREEQPVDVNAKTGPRVVFPPLTQNANPPSVASASTAARPTGAGVGNGTLTGGEEPRKIRTLSIRPDQADANAAAPAPAAAAPRAQAPAQRTPAPASTASTGAPPAANAPVALTPQAAPAEARPKVAALNPSAGASGAYVQVSSQKSEADARASFRALQGKYSGILGSRTASIHKAEIAGKGTFYRAMVGPFGTGDEATQFCVNLKSAGGQCVVQRN